ncbi:TetR/AcrR family transcriptional regulator [Nocardia sp. NRRL S-836]|uniref:TetR/AcrR family transcriptional regulator n=1 Tax=Nocardia sp. NRRL S-836 TaxID=1519492 RepID=UPI0006AECDCA|nr:TetR/AcrR family transcriptional regulator [Nocardia sp. NRRL S-836]KOV81739.1 TetR family transcriptional regulator [Nocardia sp. NRRL S-836]
MPRPSVEAERKAQILVSTCRVIATEGFRHLRVSDVARDAGVSGGTVHYYFETKRELTDAAFAHCFEQSLKRRRWILESDEPPLSRLRMVVESYLPQGAETVEAWKIWAELWVEAIRSPELQELNERFYGEWREIVASIFRDGQETGDIRSGDDPVLLANMLVSMLDGLALQVLAGSRSMTVDTMRATCLRFVDQLSGVSQGCP